MAALDTFKRRFGNAYPNEVATAEAVIKGKPLEP